MKDLLIRKIIPAIILIILVIILFFYFFASRKNVHLSKYPEIGFNQNKFFKYIPRNNSIKLKNGKTLFLCDSDRNSDCNKIFVSDRGVNNSKIFATFDKCRINASLVKLKDGRILISGGRDRDLYYDIASLTKPSPEHYSSAFIFDPDSKKITDVGNMSKPRTSHKSTLLSDGKVLITDGLSTELFDTSTNSFSKGMNMNGHHGSNSEILALSDGKALIISPQTGYAEIFIPGENKFKVIRGLPFPYSFDYKELPDNKILFTIDLSKDEQYKEAGGRIEEWIFDPNKEAFYKR